MRDRDHRLPALLVLLVLVGRVAAGDPEPARSAKKVKPGRTSEVTAEEEKEVVRFLREHHAELAGLLEHLQSSSPADYSKAIRDLWKARERLRQIEQRDRTRYELELGAWVVQSKIQLLVARLAMKDSDSLREELRSLLGQRIDLKLRLLLGERERQVERLRKLDEQVERYQSDRAEMIDKQFLLLTDSSQRLKQRRGELSTTKSPRSSKSRKPENAP
jgi:hypothetical protein